MKLHKMRSMPFRIACACLVGACLPMAHANEEAPAHDHDRAHVQIPQEGETGPAGHIHHGMHSEEEALREAIWYASAEGSLELLRRLLREDDVDVDDTAVGHFTTPLWIAAQQGHADVVRILLMRGASVDSADNIDRRTPLLQAAQEGHTEVVRILLDHGADIEARSASNSATPLFVASARGHADVVRLLLDAGADITATAKAGERDDTPLSIATDRGHADVVELLATTMAEAGR